MKKKCLPIGETDNLILRGNFVDEYGEPIDVTLKNLHQIAGTEFEEDYVMVSPVPTDESQELHAPLCTKAGQKYKIMTMKFSTTDCTDFAVVPVKCQ
ncbi:MAG: hypothetical protein F6K09_19270 [Merismopedia sp. SIO2A8]|nr:hypothetical protein [Symploca sp. SIO2B6]NET50787.1 hypothetical protein [Merismopedia sp. SIO2A8]